MSAADGIAACEMLFERQLAGHRLMSNANHLRGSAWLNFPRVACERWYHDNIVLLGDAAHTRPFLDRLGHQARPRGCDRARRCAARAA